MPIHYSVRDSVAEILFDHPPVNAFDTKGWESIPALVYQASADEGVRCVLIESEAQVSGGSRALALTKRSMAELAIGLAGVTSDSSATSVSVSVLMPTSRNERSSCH